MVRNFAVSLLSAAALMIAFFAGRASAPDPRPAKPTPPLAGIANESIPGPGRFDAPMPEDARTALLRALELPTEQRKQAIHQAVNAWLAEDGAAALRTARDDPRLAEVVGLMMRVAVVLHPDVFIEDPSLLQGVSEVDGPLAAGAETVAVLSRDLAREALVGLRHDGGMPRAESPFVGEGQPLSVEDAYTEVESILAERSPMKRWPRLITLVHQMAEIDPAATATLVDSLPASAKRHATNVLIAPWAQSDPLAVAHWLNDQDGQTSQRRFTQLAQQWGMQDFHSASAYADTLSGAQRQGFLEGLASAAHSLPSPEQLAWIAHFEGDSSYASLAAIVAQGMAREDLGAALSLIESLPPSQRLNGYAFVLPMMAMQDPEAAVATIKEIGDPSERDHLVAIAAPIWAQWDPDLALNQALDLQPGPTRDQALASLTFTLARMDSPRAIEVIDQIDDPGVRRAPVHALLGLLEDENEAIRLGREHGFDRETVLEARANSPGILSGSIMPMPFMAAPGRAVVDFGPPSAFTTYFAAPSTAKLNDGSGKLSAADTQPDEDR